MKTEKLLDQSVNYVIDYNKTSCERRNNLSDTNLQKDPGKLPEDSTRLGRLTLRFNKQRRTWQSGNHYLLKNFGYGRDRTHPSSQVTYHPTINSNQAEKFSILKQNDVFIIGKRCSFTAVNKIFQYKVL